MTWPACAGRVYTDAGARTHDQYDVVFAQLSEAGHVSLVGGIPVGHQRTAEPTEPSAGATEALFHQSAPEAGHCVDLSAWARG